MIRTVIQQGDPSRPTRTAEFDERAIVYMELVETEGVPAKLMVTLQPDRVITISEPEVIARVWKPERAEPRTKPRRPVG